MMSDLPPLISVVLIVTLAFAVIWVVAETGRRSSVRGSHPRYVWASAERACRYPALFYLTTSAVVNYWYDQWLYAVVDAAGVALWGWVLHEKKRDGDDDDYWKRLKKKIQRLAPTPVASTGGL